MTLMRLSVSNYTKCIVEGNPCLLLFFIFLFFPQVIVFYHHPSAQGISVMWPGNKIPAPWANTTEPNKLIQVRTSQTLAVISAACLCHAVGN